MINHNPENHEERPAWQVVTKKVYRNAEHYEDPTAGQAMENLEQEGWEYNKIRYKMLQRESAEMIKKMKRSGTWPGRKSQLSPLTQKDAGRRESEGRSESPSGEAAEQSWRLVWSSDAEPKGKNHV